MLWIKFILLTIGILYGISIAVRTYSKNSVPASSMFFAAVAFAGFIMLQWLRK